MVGSDHHTVAAVTSIGGGLLLGAITIDLYTKASNGIGPIWIILILLSTVILFSGVNYLISQRGAHQRKCCADCVPQPVEDEEPSSCRAIAVGTVMDALPEALVLGVTLAACSSSDRQPRYLRRKR